MNRKVSSVLMVIILIGVLYATTDYPTSKLTALGQVGTSVGGILWDNTTWTPAHSPYVITSTVQVPSNVTLTIEAGTSITTTMNQFSSDYLFLINGMIIARGMPNTTITFDGAGLGFFSAVGSKGDSFANLDYCIFKNGRLFWNTFGNVEGRGHFNLTHSQILNVGNAFSILYPLDKDVFIEYNVFVNSSGFRIWNNASVYIRNNLFYGKNIYQNYLIENWNNGANKTIVQYNSFLNISGIVLSLAVGYSNVGMNASENYWGTTNLNLIRNMIHDNNTDITCPAAINYLPILLAPDSGTPTADLIPPTTTHDYDFGWRTSNFIIKLNATDNESGVAETYYRINSGPIRTISADGQPYLTSEGALNTMEYWSIDVFGNEELPHKLLTGIKLDKGTPAGSILINQGAAYTNITRVNLTLTATDSVSGVSQMRFSNDDGVWSNWEPYATSKSWTTPASEGVKNIFVQYRDFAGLNVTSYNSITLDMTPPVANAGQNQTVTINTSITFNGNGSTDNTGISSYLWAFGDGTTGTGLKPIHTYIQMGTYVVNLTVVDLAGNRATNNSTVSVQVTIPEFPSNMLMMLVMVSILMGAVLCGKRFLRKQVSHPLSRA